MRNTMRPFRTCLLSVVLLTAALPTLGCRHPTGRHESGCFDVLCPHGVPVRSYHYLRYEPPGFDDPTRKDERWPLLLYLPGMLSFGTDVARLASDDPPGEIEAGRDLPMVVLTPMTPTYLERWSPALLISIIDYAIAHYRVDPDRVYVSGVSLGGIGAWDLAKAYPDRIAAIAPVATWGSPAGIERMKDVPVWAFHGGLDFAIWPVFHARMIRALRCTGGTPRWTVIPLGFHWIWGAVYAQDELYTWMLAQSLSKRGICSEQRIEKRPEHRSAEHDQHADEQQHHHDRP